MIRQNKFYLLIFVFLSILIIVLPFKYLLHYALDDSFFYIKTAFNFALGNGSSFDSINSTNGYHPLWFLILTTIYLPFNLFKNISPELVYKLTFLTTIIINLVTIYYLRLFINTIYKIDEIKITVFILLLIIPLVLLNIIGMETQLEVMLFSFYLYSYTHSLKYKKSEFWKRSIVVSLLLLTRLEFTFFLLPFVINLELKILDKIDLKQKFKSILIFLIIPFALQAIYYLSNFYFFGRFDSISGLIKISFHRFLLFRNLPYPVQQPINFIVFTFIIFSGIIYFSYIKKKIMKGIDRLIFKVIESIYFCGLLILLANYIFNLFGCAEWYYSTASFAGVLLISPLIILVKSLKYFIIGFSGIIFLCYFTIFRINYYNWDDVYNYSGQIKSIVNKDEYIFQFDACGIIGFFSERKVINGDGLINSFLYYKLLKTGKLKKYMDSIGVNYYGTDSFVNLINNNKIIDKRDGYLFQYPSNRIKLKCEFRYGGIFRHKKEYFYLIQIKP